jgi:hypothetical protein
MQPRVHGARIHKACHCHLLNAPQPLKIRMLNNAEQQRMIDGDKTVYRVVDNFSPNCHTAKVI